MRSGPLWCDDARFGHVRHLHVLPKAIIVKVLAEKSIQFDWSAL